MRQKVVVGMAISGTTISDFRAEGELSDSMDNQAAVNAAKQYVENNPTKSVAVLQSKTFSTKWYTLVMVPQAGSSYNNDYVKNITLYSSQVSSTASPVTDSINFGALAVRKYIGSATYVQKYKGVAINAQTFVISDALSTFTSENANTDASKRIFNAKVQQLTTFSAPAKTSITKSFTYDPAKYTPLSDSKNNGDGKLLVQWTKLSENAAFTGSTTSNTHFFDSIKYKISVTGTATSLGGNDDLAASAAETGVKLTGLNIGVRYVLTIQAFFVNPDNCELTAGGGRAVDRRIYGAASDSVNDGTSPFYYPDGVGSKPGDYANVTGSTLNIKWNAATTLNGVGKAGSDTTLAYAYILKTNGSAAGAKYVDAANANVATNNFAKGSGYQTTVYTAYKTTRHATESKHSTSATTKFDIYYAEIIPPVITLATDANDTPSNGTVTAKYANNGNNAVLNFHKLKLPSTRLPDLQDPMIWRSGGGLSF